MEAIVIIELPDDADLTKLIANVNIEKVRECGYDYEPYTFRLHCPLRPIPEKLNIHSWFEKYHSGGDVETRDAKCYGWNKCIDEILGETE